jgi:glycosyltransferase involved in cell wall biosynthesis
VQFLGQRSDVPALMAAMDLLLLPSWGEPFGTVVAEGMAVGAVPLVSDDGGPGEYVVDGVSGRVLPAGRRPDMWARAAADLLDDRARLDDMSRRAAETAARFTTSAYMRGFMAAYESAAGVGSAA